MAHAGIDEHHHLTIPEAATMLRVSIRGVWRLLQDGSLTRVRIGGRSFVSRESIKALINGQSPG